MIIEFDIPTVIKIDAESKVWDWQGTTKGECRCGFTGLMAVGTVVV